MRITVCNLKGGASKTTTAVFLAIGLARRSGQRVLLVDADPGQPQTQRWAVLAGDAWPASVEVVTRVTRSLGQQLRHDADGYEHLVVDLGPKNAGMLRETVEVAPELIIPTKARLLDLDGVRDTVQACTGVQTEVYPRVLFVQTRAPRKVRESRELVESWRIDAFKTHIRELEAYDDAAATVPSSLLDYDGVLDELEQGTA
jgi:chromosome partitioning protein